MRVARDLRRTGMTAYEPYDLAPHHARALRVVGHHGTMRLGELAQHLRVAPRSVTDVVDALEERGLAERSPDPTDRRAQVVGLTDAGRRLVDEVDAARRTGAEAYFGRLPERDRASLRRILERLDATD
ncbi:MarR family transcriptional regulator [Phycicoccus sp. MQZ13P-5]|uniref:MarR family transcriptional regulator n=2 Tax=Phycicoccus sonneratiae TaxID=2807628 RepID=A0ABS2CPW2_9MICO|nr:MarR family transcriptional regulator [Phycicoccus sonneraticus]